MSRLSVLYYKIEKQRRYLSFSRLKIRRFSLSVFLTQIRWIILVGATIGRPLDSPEFQAGDQWSPLQIIKKISCFQYSSKTVRNGGLFYILKNEVSKRYGVSIKNAERLVRTETNYIANQSELESYKESGIEKYRFTATLDSRTSAVCQQLDGQEFLVSEAQAGVNLHPMHAHCRSTTISVISEKCLENLERRAKNSDGTTSKVPADMSYKEWKNSLNVSNELQQMPLTLVSNSGKLRDIESNIIVNTKYFKGKLKHYDITDERINKIPLINLSSLSSEQNIKLQQACKNLLDFMRNEPLGTEGAIILNSSADEINRYKAEKANGNVKLKLVDENHIAIHNHPDGLIFSIRDVETFIECESLRILGAVGNNGTVYFIEKTNDFDSYYFNNYKDNIRMDYLVNMPPEEHIKFIEEVMKGAEEYGVKFYTSENQKTH